jgi:hypothetical protein
MARYGTAHARRRWSPSASPPKADMHKRLIDVR